MYSATKASTVQTSRPSPGKSRRPVKELKKQAPADNLEYWKHGYWHICFTDPEIDALVARIVAAGGKQRTDVWAFIPGTDRKLCYCEDPFGNVIEIFSHTYEQTFANWPLPGQATG